MSEITETDVQVAKVLTKKSWSRNHIYITISLGVVVIFFGFIMWVQSESNKEKDKKIQEFQELYSTELNTKDSALNVINKLSNYRELSESMIYRDSIRKFLKYQVGDIVHKKLDSSKVIISDIITGGDKYTYYIKYIVTNKDNKLEEISPYTIY